MPSPRFLSMVLVAWVFFAFVSPANAQGEPTQAEANVQISGINSPEGTSESGSTPMAPLLLVAIPNENVAILAWIAGGPGAMTHKVYGYKNGVATHVETTTSGRTVAIVTSGTYDRFGVSALVDGRESSVTTSLNIPIACVDVEGVNPPHELPHVSSGCLPIRIKPSIQ